MKHENWLVHILETRKVVENYYWAFFWASTGLMVPLRQCIRQILFARNPQNCENVSFFKKSGTFQIVGPGQ